MESQPQASQLQLLAQTPSFCEYADGPCDQSFENIKRSGALFLYPSEPTIIATTIEEAVRRLTVSTRGGPWVRWRDLCVQGKIIFCEICKALRFTAVAIADVTTLNFNLLFEMGYALGIAIPVLPIRDTSYARDATIFNELGLIDTLGYLDFQNSAELAQGIISRGATVIRASSEATREQGAAAICNEKSRPTEGMVRLMSAVKKSGLRFRSFDPRESARLSLHEAFKDVHSSMGVIVHLMAPHRRDSVVHNSRCAFVAGLAMSASKQVLMLQETSVPQAIDYRDVVRCYTSPKAILTC